MRTARVLVVDDDSNNEGYWNLFRTILDSPPGESQIVPRLLKRSRKQGFDVILMNWRMPEEDGAEYTKRLRQLVNCRSIEKIAVTAMALNGDKLV